MQFVDNGYVTVQLPDKKGGDSEVDENLQGFIEEPAKPTSAPSDAPASVWNFKFYQHFFDVDTNQVLRRLAYAIIPNPRTSFVQHILRPHADLYGPFWIATTLILAAAIGGNVSSYLQSRGQLTSWKYDFRKVTLASTIIYLYWWFIPLGITAFAYMRSKRAQESAENDDRESLISDSSSHEGRSLSVPAHKFVDLLSVYGYSLAVFVPVSILWVIPNSVFQWILVAIAMAVSSAFLTFALFPLFRRDHQKLAVPLLVALIVLHCLFCIGLMVTFFHGTSPTPSVPSVVPPPVAPADVKPADGAAPAAKPEEKVNKTKREALNSKASPSNARSA